MSPCIRKADEQYFDRIVALNKDYDLLGSAQASTVFERKISKKTAISQFRTISPSQLEAKNIVDTLLNISIETY